MEPIDFAIFDQTICHTIVVDRIGIRSIIAEEGATLCHGLALLDVDAVAGVWIVKHAIAQSRHATAREDWAFIFGDVHEIETQIGIQSRDGRRILCRVCTTGGTGNFCVSHGRRSTGVFETNASPKCSVAADDVDFLRSGAVDLQGAHDADIALWIHADFHTCWNSERDAGGHDQIIGDDVRRTAQTQCGIGRQGATNESFVRWNKNRLHR